MFLWFCWFQQNLVGYTRSDVVYTWNRQRQVAIAEDMKLSQFDLIATPSANQTDALPPGELNWQTIPNPININNNLTYQV